MTRFCGLSVRSSHEDALVSDVAVQCCLVHIETLTERNTPGLCSYFVMMSTTFMKTVQLVKPYNF